MQLGGAALLGACGGKRGATATPTLRMGAAGSDDGDVHEYVSHPRSFSTSSYWIEGPSGLVMIDTQFLPSACAESLALAEARTGQRVELAIVTHANPDKFNGTAVLQERGIEVVTSAQVLALLPAVHEKRVRAFYDRYAPDYPKALPQPTSFGAVHRELEAAGLKLGVHVLGAGCSEAHVVVTWDDHAFVGDLVAIRAHSWLEIGKPDAWRERIAEIERLGVQRIHCGRSGSGGPEVLAAESDYLAFVRELVAAEHPQGEPDPAVVAKLEQAVIARYPEHRFAVFLKMGIPAVWRALASA